MKSTAYFFKTFFALLVATVAFFVFKLVLPEHLFPGTSEVLKNVTVDSLMLEAVAKTSGILHETIDTTVIQDKITFEAIDGIQFPAENYETYEGHQYLIPFYEKLFLLETQQKGKVRIAYFGDSMTDGDMIVKDFRKFLQEKFGGEGVGFVNITSESASSRSSLRHTFSPNWSSESYMKVRQPSAFFGVNGHVFYANDSLAYPWVNYKANNTPFATTIDQPTLFYGESANKGGSVFYVSKGDTISRKLNPSKVLNTVKISAGRLPSLQLYFKNADSIPFYGLNFDDGKGIHVDNFSSRGNSGLPLSLFSKKMMAAFQKELGYDLIVLHYGTNVLNYGSLNYSWYERRMEKVVAHLRECFPGVAILIVSTADKATKYDLKMRTDSAVVPLSLAQKRYAIASNSGFVNLFQLMGGDGSMIQWVEEEPSKANKDYTHFNHRGANAVGKMMFDQIQNGYNRYYKMRTKRQVVKKQSDSIHQQSKDTLDVP